MSSENTSRRRPAAGRTTRVGAIAVTAAAAAFAATAVPAASIAAGDTASHHTAATRAAARATATTSHRLAPTPTTASRPAAQFSDAYSRTLTEGILTRVTAAPSTTPSLVAPTAGSTVSGVTSFAATTGDGTKVLFNVGALHAFAPVVDGVATLDVDTYGLAEGAATVTVAGCDDTNACGPTSSPTTVTVANGTPSITSPAKGAKVGTSFVVSAANTGGLLQFKLDGALVAQATSAPYQATIDASGLADGDHTLQIVRCNTAGSLCQPASAPGYTVHLVTALDPVMSQISPARISPNGDGRFDAATIRYTLDQSQTASWSVLNAAGSVVRGPVNLGQLASGAHSFVFDGKDAAKRPLPSGGYRVRLDTTVDLGGDSSVNGRAERAITVDLKAPTASGVNAIPKTVYPVKDNYVDTTKLIARPSEQLTSVKVEVRNGAGRVVRILDAGGYMNGTKQVVWNGRTATGTIVPAGTYRFRFVMRDTAGNDGRTGDVPVVVSAKKLVKYTATKVMVPKPTVTKTLIGSCSRVEYPAKPSWPGSLAYLSNYAVCYDPSASEEVAITQHTLTLPAATKYGSIRVSAYGSKDLANFNDIGLVLYQDKGGDLSDYGVELHPAARWYTGDLVNGSDFVSARKFKFWAGTSLGNYYDIKSFKVTYSYFQLK